VGRVVVSVTGCDTRRVVERRDRSGQVLERNGVAIIAADVGLNQAAVVDRWYAGACFDEDAQTAMVGFGIHRAENAAGVDESWRGSARADVKGGCIAFE